jgi:hypothetical protein
MKMVVFWVAAQSTLVDVADVSEALVAAIVWAMSYSSHLNFHQTSRRDIAEDRHFHTRHRDNLKSH